MGKSTLDGKKFEKIMEGRPEERRNEDTAETIMLVADVVGMKNTVQADLAEESAMRRQNASEEAAMAVRLRADAEACDRRKANELKRKGVVDRLMALLPKRRQ